MTIRIDGTTGISGVDGTATAPAVQGNDTNTGVFFPANDTIAFAEGGTEVMRIDANGRVGIGNTAPLYKLHVEGAIFSGREDTSAEGGQIGFGRSSDNIQHYSIDAYGAGSTPSLRFVDAAAGVVRMNIDSSGRVTMPSQPAFLATGAGYNAQYFSSASIGNFTIFNIGSHFSQGSTGTARFTAPVAGRYLFSAGILWYNSALTAPRSLVLRRNGAVVIQYYADSASSQNHVITVTGIVNLNASDWVDASASQTSGAAAFYDNGATTGNYGNSNYNWFSGYLVG